VFERFCGLHRVQSHCFLGRAGVDQCQPLLRILLQNRPYGRKGFPYLRCAARRVIPLPCVRSGFLAGGYHKAGNEAGPTEKETNYVSQEHEKRNRRNEESPGR
jgi:hypothetical protein